MLADDLRAEASVDLGDVFGDLAGAFVDVDLGTVRFDASGILDLVERAVPPDLGGVVGSVAVVAGQLQARVGVGLPGGELPGILDSLTAHLGAAGDLIPSIDVGTDIGLDGLSARLDTVTSAVGQGALPALAGLVPGLRLPDAIARVGGGVGGLIDLVRVLAGLTATSAVSDKLLARSERLAAQLDVDTARELGASLARLSADTGLVAALRAAPPDDRATVERLGARVVAFLDATLAVGDRWTAGMAFGEAALSGVDLAGGAAGLELARLAVSGADLTRTAELVADIRRAGAPFLDLELPTGSPDVVDQALALVVTLTDGVRSWDPATITGPLNDLAALALGPLDEVRRAIESVAGGAASAIRSVGQLVEEVDLGGVADSIRAALQPVTDTLDAIEDAIGEAQAVLQEVAGNMVAGLQQVQAAVAGAAVTVTGALGRVEALLATLDLEGLAERLRSALGSVAAALASAQLSPYFDTAISVIDTGAEVIDAVPFELLPTDVQQEVVDACRPIKQLDLQGVEDALRAELTEIRGSFRADALAAIEAAYAEIVDFLASLDPEPALVELEGEPLQALRDAVAAVDPDALLEPATTALAGFRGFLDAVDLEEQVRRPLREAFAPVTDALAALEPAALLADLTSGLDGVRQTLTEALPLDTVTGALEGFRERVAAVVARVDPAALAEALDDAVAGAIAELPAGPPGGPFGSLLVTLAQATGLDATEGAVGDTIAWVRGQERGSVEVKGRLTTVAERIAGVRDGVRSLDPAPLAAAAQAQHRALSAAVAVHPPDSRLRVTLEPLLSGVTPAAVLGPLTENRARYVLALDVAATASAALAAPGRAEIDTAAADVHAALLPLGAFPAKLRALLGALGIEHADQPLAGVVAHLLEIAGPARLVPALTDLAATIRDKVMDAVDAALAPALDAVATIRGIIDAIDLGPIVDELNAVHAQVSADVAAFAPDALLGDVLDEVGQIVERLREFDPLAPVRDVLGAAKDTANAVIETARPTVVFAPVVEIHGELVDAASGLDVASLLRPVLDALDSLAGQLDDGFDRTGDALIRLQAALPSEVSASSVSASVEVGIG